MRRLLFGIVLAGCGGDKSSGELPPIASNVSAVGSAISARDAGAADALPRGTPARVDLSTLPNPLPASIVVLAGATTTTSTELLRDPDGLAYKGAVVEIEGGGGPALRLTSGRDLDFIPTTLDDELAHNRIARHPAKVDGSTRSPGGAWAVSYRERDGTCRVIGWAPKAHVACASQGSLPCTGAPAVLTACTSLEPVGTPAVPVGDVAMTFPLVKDPKALDTIAAAARAIARNDRDGIAATIGPDGVLLKGKKLSRAGLQRLLATDTVQRAFEIDCKIPKGVTGPTCTWMTEGVTDDSIDVIPRELGDDVIPRFTVARAFDGAWWLTKVDLLDPHAGR